MRSDKCMLKGERLRGYQDHEATFTQQDARPSKGRAKGSRHLASRNRSLQQSSQVHDPRIGKNRYNNRLAQASAYDARYRAVAQPEVAYTDFYRGESAPSPPPSPIEEMYTYCGYSREKGEHFEFDDDRPLPRKRIAWLRLAQVGDNHIPFSPNTHQKRQGLRVYQVCNMCVNTALTMSHREDFHRLRRRGIHTMPYQRLQPKRAQRQWSTTPAVGFQWQDCFSTFVHYPHRLALDILPHRIHLSGFSRPVHIAE